MDDILDNIIKGIVTTLDLNEEIEDNMEKIIRLKSMDISSLLSKKGFKNEEFQISQKMNQLSEKYFINFLEKEIRFFLNQFMDYQIWKHYKTNTPKENIASYLNNYIKKNLGNKKFRKNFYSIMNLWKSDIVQRYCDGLYYRKGYGSLYIFSKPINTPSLLNEFLKFALLFYNVGIFGFDVSGESHYIEQHIMSKESLGNFFNFLEKYNMNTFGDFPFEITRTGVEAAINKQKLKYEFDTNNRADILRIFLLMAKFQQKNASASNKRAETPEKSLLSLFQKDFQFLGVDKNFLYELEMIARENRW